MKELDLQRVTDEVERMCIEGNYFIGKEVLDLSLIHISEPTRPY